jgi:hypothetical protein
MFYDTERTKVRGLVFLHLSHKMIIISPQFGLLLGKCSAAYHSLAPSRA